jgi:hypothetical protein
MQLLLALVEGVFGSWFNLVGGGVQGRQEGLVRDHFIGLWPG